MNTGTFVQALVDAILSRLDTAKATFGTPTISEWAESVVVIDSLPAVFVLPMSNKGNIEQAQGSDDVKITVPITIAGYYNPDNNTRAQVTTSMRTTRLYAFLVSELFRGDNAIISFASGGVSTGVIVESLDVEVGYWGIVDEVVHSFSISFVCKGYVP
jgi:hypothetical protein